MAAIWLGSTTREKQMRSLVLAIGLLLGLGAHAEVLLFGVNEGTSGVSGFNDRQEKYQPLAAYLSKVMSRDVRLESASDLKNLTRSLTTSRYDLVLIRPSHISAAAMRDQRYTLVAAAQGDSIAYFIVHKESPLKSYKDLAGKSLAMPDEIAYPTKIGQAMLRDAALKPAPNVRMFRVQEAVGYAVENKLIDAGVVISYSKVAKDWQKNGHRFLWQSEKLPYWSIIGSPKLKPEQVNKIRDALIALDKTAEGKAMLEKIGIKAFVPGNQQAYLDMLSWIEKK